MERQLVLNFAVKRQKAGLFEKTESKNNFSNMLVPTWQLIYKPIIVN